MAEPRREGNRVHSPANCGVMTSKPRFTYNQVEFGDMKGEIFHMLVNRQPQGASMSNLGLALKV